MDSDDDFKEFYESFMGGNYRKKRESPEAEVVDDSEVFDFGLIDSYIIFVSLALMEATLFKSGYDDDTKKRIHKRIKEIAKSYGPNRKAWR